ncbi:MAG: hypothetical protein GTN76_14880 [Candidatus Aenigmarchaeota archaeon]|nr:hypothetical protein [Candidatus Aenigmarchaeota archaeon]
MKRIKWGANVSDFSDLVLLGAVDGGKKVYRREGGRIKIGDAKIEVVLYGFYKDRLEDLQIHFRSFSNFAKLKETWFRVYGSGYQLNPPKETYRWNGRKFSMFFAYDATSGKGAIGCTHIPIYRERQRMRRNLEEYKEMVERLKMVKKESFQTVGRGRHQGEVRTERRVMV